MRWGLSLLPTIEASDRNGTARAVDFDLHGLVGVRLLGARSGDVAAVTRQLGPVQAPLNRDPDILIQFVERLEIERPIRYLGDGEVGFTQEAFLILRGKGKADVRVQIPLQHIGQQCRIVCQTGVPEVPLLIAVVNVTALAKNAVPLHGSAFLNDGVGIVTAGWSKGGKTELLLGFMAHGATYVGDEWVYVNGDASRVYGIPEPIRLWNWHLRDFREYRRFVGWGARARLGVLEVLHLLGQAALRKVRLFQTPVLGTLTHLVRRRLFVDVQPHRLFTPERCSLSGPFDKILFVVSHASPEITVRAIDAEEVARRMAFSLQYEQLPLIDYYLRFRFAFPSLRNEFLECASELQRELLLRALAGKPAYEVCHPYPVSLRALYEAVLPVCR